MKLIKNYKKNYILKDRDNLSYLNNEFKLINKNRLMNKKFPLCKFCGIMILFLNSKIKVINKKKYHICFCRKFRRLISKKYLLKFFFYETLFS